MTPKIIIKIPGPQGSGGWSPILSMESVEGRTLLKVIDWIGGGGTKPDVDLYVSSEGYTNDPTEAFGLGGAPGESGVPLLSKTQLRAGDVGNNTFLHIENPANGSFRSYQYDPADTISPDNDDTVLVDVDGKRYKIKFPDMDPETVRILRIILGDVDNYTTTSLRAYAGPPIWGGYNTTLRYLFEYDPDADLNDPANADNGTTILRDSALPVGRVYRQTSLVNIVKNSRYR